MKLYKVGVTHVIFRDYKSAREYEVTGALRNVVCSERYTVIVSVRDNEGKKTAKRVAAYRCMHCECVAPAGTCALCVFVPYEARVYHMPPHTMYKCLYD